MTTKIIEINQAFADSKKIQPLCVVALMVDSGKAHYIYGQEKDGAKPVDFWIPKAAIKNMWDTDLVVTPPTDHYILKRREGAIQQIKKAELGKGNVIVIEMSYNALLIGIIKSMPGRKWDTRSKTWVVPVNMSVVQTLRDNEFQLGPRLQEWEEMNKPVEMDVDFDIPGLNVQLRPFQLEGVKRAVEFRDRSLIADDMGLGKTAQGIGWLQFHKEQRPALVICPASLKEMWSKYLNTWMSSEKVHVISGRPGKKEKLPKASIYVVNYDIIGNKVETTLTKEGKKKKKELPFTGWVDYLVSANIKMTVCDEAHYLKNKNSLRSIGGLKCLSTSPMALALSGTPILNRPAEFWPVLNALKPSVFRNFFDFGKRYCNAKHNGWGWDFSGSSNREELNKLLTSTCMIRRLKSEVLKQLPPKQRCVIPLPMAADKIKQYQKAEKALAESKGEEKAEQLKRIIVLKKAATAAKLDAACQWIEDFLESGEKLVLFAHHHFAVDALKERLSKITMIAEITGRTVGSKQEQEDLFQNDPNCQLFIGSKSAAEGLTLTASSNVAFLEMFDTPGLMAQAEDRVHRIGQESDSVMAWYLVAAGTIEEDQALMLDKKLTVIKSIVDGKNTENEELVSFLLKTAMKRSIDENKNNR